MFKMDFTELASCNNLIHYSVMSFSYKISPAPPAESVSAFFGDASFQIADQTSEYLIIGYFDDQQRLIQIGEVWSDEVDAVSVPVRKITHDALNLDAHSIILMHNHPSGDPRPSQGDIKQTREIARILGPLGIHLDDHLIVAGNRQFSFREAGML